MRSLFTAALVLFGVFAGGNARADTLVVVSVESDDSTVTSSRVRERMRENGVRAMGAADAPAGPIATLVVVYRGAGEQTRFRLRARDGRVVVRDFRAPSTNTLQWVARRSCQLVRASSAAPEPAPRRATTEVLNPWDDNVAPDNRAASRAVVNPWDTAEEPARQRRRRRRRSVGRVAGASATRYSEVLDPWAQSGRNPADIVDPWQQTEGGDGLARPARRRR